MNKSLATLLTSTALILIAISNASFAASDGSFGTTSTGTVVASLTMSSKIQIKGLTDLSFGTVAPDVVGDLNVAENVCVHSNAVSGETYNVTASTGSGAYNLVNGSNTIPFSVAWSSASGTTTFTSGSALTYNTKLATIANLSHVNGCGNTTNASLMLKIANSAVQYMPAGAYSSTLNLTVGMD